MLAIAPAQQLLGPEIVELDVAASGKPMLLADNDVEIFREQRPDVEPLPGFADLGGNAELGLALLQEFGDLAARPAQEAEFEPVELPLDLVEMRNEQSESDRVRQR